MAYTKQTWENLPSQTTPINADRLTHIEDGIFNAAATADTAASDASSAISGLADKVDKVEGKGLSTNDFTDALKTKLDNIETGAEVNVQSDWNQSDNSADDYIKNKPSLGTSAYKNSTSVVTDSSDLVESGAVKGVIGWGNKNLLPNNRGNSTNTGVSWTVNSDLSVTANRVSSSSDNSTYALSVTIKKSGRYIASGCPVNGSSSTYRVAIIINGNVSGFDSGSGYEFEASANDVVTYRPTVYSSYSANNLTFYPMISRDGGAYEPYHAPVSEFVPQVVSDAVGWDVGDLLKLTLADLKSINTAGTWNNNKYTHNGIEYTVNDDMIITTLGTASGNSNFYYFRYATSANYPHPMKLSGCPSGGGANSFSQLVQEDGGVFDIIARDTGSGALVTLSDGIAYRCSIRVSSGITCNNTFAPKLVNMSVDEQKADNTVIGTVEDGATASQAYAVGSHAIRNGKFITWVNAKAQGETINDSSDYTSEDVASELESKSGTISQRTASVTLTGANLRKYGKIVDFGLILTVSEEIPSGTEIALFSEIPLFFKLFPIFDRSTFNLLTYSMYINTSNGCLVPEQRLPVGEYRVYGTYICK